MAYDVLTTDEFDAWFDGLTDQERRRLAPKIDRLEERGPTLDYPESSSIRGSAHGAKMRELRIQIDKEPFRILYAFDVLQRAVLLQAETRWAMRSNGTNKSFPLPTGSLRLINTKRSLKSRPSMRLSKEARRREASDGNLESAQGQAL